MPNDSKQGLLFIHALTALHPGSGSALGVVDLPVQRERHTQWPIIPGSAVKGVLRDAATRATAKKDEKLLTAFGPDTSDADAYAGAISLTDARLIAFPVRSLKGVFAWVTCPAALQRLSRDLKLAGLQSSIKVQSPDAKKAITSHKSPLTLDDGNQKKLILEEFDFTVESQTDDTVAKWISENAISDKDTSERIMSHLVILNDDDFGHFVKHATEVVARIKLDYATKTVKDGALFYEEFLPTDCIFYSVAFANPSRSGGVKMNATETYSFLSGVVNSRAYLQFGADETIGKGICAVKMTN